MIVQMAHVQLFEHWRNYSLNKFWENTGEYSLMQVALYIWSFISRSEKEGLQGFVERIMKYNWNNIHIKSFFSEKLTFLLMIKTQKSNVIFDIFSRNILNIHVTVTAREMAVETVQL